MSALELHPMEWGEIVEHGLSIYRRNFVTLYLVSLAPMLLSWVFQLPLQALTQGEEFASLAGAASPFAVMQAMMHILPWVVLVAVGAGLCQIIMQGALTLAVSRLVFGEEVRVGQALAGAIYRLPTLVAAAILVGLASFAGLLACVLPLFFVMLALYLVVPAIVIDDAGPFRALRRSWDLMIHGTTGLHPLVKGLVLGLLVLAVATAVGAMAAIPQFAVTFMMTFSQTLKQGPGSNPFAMPGIPLPITAATTLFQTLVTALVPPLAACAKVLLYYDLKLRKEDFSAESGAPTNQINA